MLPLLISKTVLLGGGGGGLQHMFYDEIRLVG